MQRGSRWQSRCTVAQQRSAVAVLWSPGAGGIAASPPDQPVRGRPSSQARSVCAGSTHPAPHSSCSGRERAASWRIKTAGARGEAWALQRVIELAWAHHGQLQACWAALHAVRVMQTPGALQRGAGRRWQGVAAGAAAGAPRRERAAAGDRNWPNLLFILPLCLPRWCRFYEQRYPEVGGAEALPQAGQPGRRRARLGGGRWHARQEAGPQG